MNDIGKIIHGSWLWLADRYDYVDLDEFIVMPNHVHGIIMIVDSAVGANNYSPTKSQRAQRPHGTSKTIGSIIRGFKIGVTKWVHQNMDMKNVWQRNYYEHIVRNEPELARTREYIKNNPIRWGVKKGKRFFALRD